MPLVTAETLDEGEAVALRWSDGAYSRFHAVWLRDNALDAETRSPANGQRLITVLDIQPQTKIAAAQVTASGNLEVRFEPEGKSVTYAAQWLAAHAYDRPQRRDAGWVGEAIETWDSGFGTRMPKACFDDIARSRAALGRWLAAVRRYGFALVEAMPVEPGALTRLVDLFGYVRETNYGRISRCAPR